MPNPAHRRQIAHADNNNNNRATGRQGNGATGQQDNPQMAPVKPICGNQIKVALQEARKNPSARGVVDSIKIKLAALLVANFVIIRCQFRVAVCVCVCVFCGTCAPTIRCQIQQTTATRPHVPQ